jgi:hypothetical protein
MQDPNPGPQVSGRYGSAIRIRTKLSRIYDTAKTFHDIKPNLVQLSRVSDPYSFFTDPDPDPEDPDGGQYGSGSNPDPGL